MAVEVPKIYEGYCPPLATGVLLEDQHGKASVLVPATSHRSIFHLSPILLPHHMYQGIGADLYRIKAPQRDRDQARVLLGAKEATLDQEDMVVEASRPCKTLCIVPSPISLPGPTKVPGHTVTLPRAVICRLSIDHRFPIRSLNKVEATGADRDLMEEAGARQDQAKYLLGAREATLDPEDMDAEAFLPCASYYVLRRARRLSFSLCNDGGRRETGEASVAPWTDWQGTTYETNGRAFERSVHTQPGHGPRILIVHNSASECAKIHIDSSG